MFNEIQHIIESLGVSCADFSVASKLGITIGLDSQEIVEFTCLIEKHFQIALSPGSFTKSSSIHDIIKKIELAKEFNGPHSSSFDGYTEASLEIDCDVQAAYLAIYEMEKWPDRLPHVKKIEILYNDGVYQEFLMDVQSESGMIHVRSIRRCAFQERQILFFQPKPPAFLIHHCGGWGFEAIPTGCRVRTWHNWNIETLKASELFGKEAEEHVHRLLHSHAEFALKNWKSFLERKQ